MMKNVVVESLGQEKEGITSCILYFVALWHRPAFLHNLLYTPEKCPSRDYQEIVAHRNVVSIKVLKTPDDSFEALYIFQTKMKLDTTVLSWKLMFTCYIF